MRRYLRWITSFTVVSTLTLGACGGDPVGVNSGDELSDAEIQAVFNAFGGAFSGVNASAHTAAPQDGIQMADIPVNQGIDVSVPCNLGGEISLDGSASGTVNDETLASDIEMDIDVEFDACAFPAEQNTVTVDGEMQFDSHLTLIEDSFSVSGSQVGGFDFTTNDGRTGSCAIDITFSASMATGTTAENTVSGTVCGRSATQFQTYMGN